MKRYIKSTTKAIKASIVDAPQGVTDELIQILGEYGFVLDESFPVNPGKTWMGRTHLQVINHDSYVEDYEVLRQSISNEMIYRIDELSTRTNCPITWSFGIDANGQITGGLDIDKQYVDDTVGASTAIESNLTPYKPKFWEQWVEDFLSSYGFGNDKFPHTLDSWYDPSTYVVTVTFENGINREEYELLDSAFTADVPEAYTYPMKHGSDLYTDIDFEFPMGLEKKHFKNFNYSDYDKSSI